MTILKKGKSYSYEVSDDGTSKCEYDRYVVGDKIKFKDEYYYVIAGSDNKQDYVIALKENPLTVDEINTYGVGHVNMYNMLSNGAYVRTAFDYGGTNHTGGMTYYSSSSCGYSDPNSSGTYTTTGCTTSYRGSEVEYVINEWAKAKFTNGELKTVDNYSARLITIEELLPFYPNCTESQMSSQGYCPEETDTPNWIWSYGYFYWTMSPYNYSSSDVWGVVRGGDLGYGSVSYVNGAVRPVINVYKSKISS